jgi:hypothetical protein
MKESTIKIKLLAKKKKKRNLASAQQELCLCFCWYDPPALTEMLRLVSRSLPSLAKELTQEAAD